jgi:hypothetical protein
MTDIVVIATRSVCILWTIYFILFTPMERTG